MLHIENLTASVGDVSILHGVTLDIKLGQVHVIMGPNGSGKSTLAQSLCGNPNITVGGKVVFKEHDLLSLAAHERSLAGLFMAFQSPVEIPGLAVATFLKSAVDARLIAQGKNPIDAYDFLVQAKAGCAKLDLDPAILKRGVNEGLSGGERKRLEMLQLILLEPTLAILDETDSGLDIDALKLIAEQVNSLRAPDKSFIIITHYHKLLDYIKPDFVHVMHAGRIVLSGDKALADEIERRGYEWLVQK